VITVLLKAGDSENVSRPDLALCPAISCSLPVSASEMSRKQTISNQKILELLIDSENDGLCDIEIDDPDESENDEVTEQEEIIYHEEDVHLEEVLYFSILAEYKKGASKGIKTIQIEQVQNLAQFFPIFFLNTVCYRCKGIIIRYGICYFTLSCFAFFHSCLRFCQ
jgi:hypothetical protein